MSKSYRLGVFGLPTTISRPLVAVFDNIGISTVVPRYFMMKKGIIRALWQKYDDFSAHVYTPELPIGGILNFDTYNFPEVPTHQGPWKFTIVQSEENCLMKVPYPNPEDPGVADPHKMTYTIPDDVYISDRDNIKVGWWDEENQKW